MPYSLAIVSPDLGDNNIKPGCSSSGDQPLFSEVRFRGVVGRRGAAA